MQDMSTITLGGALGGTLGGAQEFSFLASGSPGERVVLLPERSFCSETGRFTYTMVNVHVHSDVSHRGVTWSPSSIQTIAPKGQF